MTCIKDVAYNLILHFSFASLAVLSSHEIHDLRTSSFTYKTIKILAIQLLYRTISIFKQVPAYLTVSGSEEGLFKKRLENPRLGRFSLVVK